jgi:hypothetical protein
VEDSRLLPVHLNFVRLLRLWPKGGFYMGFSFLLVRPVPEGDRIVDLGPGWLDEEPAGAPSTAGWRGDNGTRASAAAAATKTTTATTATTTGAAACGNEMFLQLPPRDPLLACVLRTYSQYFSVGGTIDPQGPCAGAGGGYDISTLDHPSIDHLRALHNKPKDTANVKKNIRPVDSWYLGYDGLDIEFEERSIRAQVCLRKLFRECVHVEEEISRADPPNTKAPSSPLRSSVVEWHHCDLEKLHEEFHGEDHPHRHVFQPLETLADIADDGLFASESKKNKDNGEISVAAASAVAAAAVRRDLLEDSQDSAPPLISSPPSKLALWVGPPALDGVWKEPRAGSSVDLRFAAVHSNLRRWHKNLQDPRCRVARNCSAFAADGAWSEHDTDRQAAKFRCAPTFVVPGTQKGASTFLFHALSRHPQVVPPLRGAHGYKVPKL